MQNGFYEESFSESLVGQLFVFLFRCLLSAFLGRLQSFVLWKLTEDGGISRTLFTFFQLKIRHYRDTVGRQ